MVKMTHKSVLSFSCWDSYCSYSIRRGMPFLHSTPLVALFHSQSSNPTKSGEIHRGVSNVEDALKVFDEMLQRRPLPSVVRFNQVLAPLVKLKHYPTVLSLNSQMLLSGIRPDHYNLAIAINCYCRLNRMDYALSVLAHFFKLGLQPDVATLNTLIHGFVLQNRVADAARVFRKMVVGGHCQPNTITFNTLIKGFCAIRNNTAAIQLLGKMEANGCQPDIITYSTIIDSLGKDTLVDEAKNLFSEMVGRGIAPNLVTYNSLIQGVCNLGRWKEATRLLYEMASQDIFPNVFTFNILADAFCKDGMVVQAKNVVQIMIQRGIEPNTIT
ncbi:hypothetical protein ACLB2K_061087 [Fragaria x ananassa]